MPRRPFSSRLYRVLLRAYPASFREDYEAELDAAFRARWRDTQGAFARAALCLEVMTDTVRTAARAHAELTLRDLRYAARTFGRHRSHAAASVVTLALGIGAVTMVFSVAWSVLRAPLPYRDGSRLAMIWTTNAPLGLSEFSESVPNFVSLQRRARSFSGLAALRSGDANITGGAELERVKGLAVSPGFFDVLGLAPVAGRSFAPGDAAAGAVMISRGFWARRFGSSPAAIGSRVEINLRPCVIVGVAPQDVGFRDDIDLWTPIPLDRPGDGRGDRRLAIVGRLAPGVSLQQAHDDLQRVAVALEAKYPETNRDWRYDIVDMRAWIVGPGLPARLRLLMAAVTLLLLIAAVDVANLQVARAAGRTRELGVRLALGATRRRLARQLLTETSLLTAIGGAAGVAVAWIGLRVFTAGPIAEIPRADAATVDVHVLAAALLATAASALLAGLVPVFAVRSNALESLAQAGRSPTSTQTPVRQALIAVQLALTTVLVISAALLAQSILRLQHVDVGFANPSRLLLAEITRSHPTADDPKADIAFYDAVLARVEALPGVVSAGISNSVPFGNGNASGSIQPYPSHAAPPVSAASRVVSRDYFTTIGVPLLQGRGFAPTGAGREVVVSASLARALWGDDRNVTGRTVTLGDQQVFTVVGVVGDVRLVDLAGGPVPTMYLSTSLYLWPTMTLTVRTAVDPLGLARPIREAVAAVDPHQPLGGVQTMSNAMANSIAEPRLSADVVAAFAAFALVLALVGIAGLVGYVVVERAPELALRMAVGASPRRAAWHVLRGAVTMSAAGIGVGWIAALACRPALASVLFGIGPADSRTYAAAAALLFTAALVAGWIPARRGARVNPATLLR